MSSKKAPAKSKLWNESMSEELRKLRYKPPKYSNLYGSKFVLMKTIKRSARFRLSPKEALNKS